MRRNATRREFVAGGAALAFLSCRGGGVVGAAGRRRLNILYIMTDDHAAHAIGAYGSRVNRTPNIDRLAKEGAMLRNCFCTNPICTPSRAGILTGEYSHRNGVPVFNDLPAGTKTVGGYMRDAGYYTAFVGKWHLGGPQTVRDGDWDRWMIYANQGVYFNPWFWERRDGAVVRTEYPDEYATENITKVTKGVIDGAVASGKPFFVMMHHKAPHRNWLPSDKYRAAFRRLTLKDIPPPDTLFDTWEGRASPIRTTAMTLLRHMRLKEDLKAAEYFSQGGEFEFEGRRYEGARDQSGRFVDDWPVGADDRARTAFSYLRYMQDYLACVQSVDDSVGEMYGFLKDRGILDDTVVIYTSDQGFFLGDHGLYDKRFIMDEVSRMPFIARCPSLIRPDTENSDMITNVDFAPTFLDVAGGERPGRMQGESFLPNMRGRTPDGWREDCYLRYYVEGGEHSTSAWYGIRTKIDALVYYYKRDEWEYFDIARDPDEKRNEYGSPEYRERIEVLKKRLAALRESLGDDDRYAGAKEYGPVE